MGIRFYDATQSSVAFHAFQRLFKKMHNEFKDYIFIRAGNRENDCFSWVNFQIHLKYANKSEEKSR